MADVISLSRARKRKRREAEQRQADANAVRHGRTKADKTRDQQQRARLDAVLDGARRQTPEPSTPSEPSDPERDE